MPMTALVLAPVAVEAATVAAAATGLTLLYNEKTDQERQAAWNTIRGGLAKLTDSEIYKKNFVDNAIKFSAPVFELYLSLATKLLERPTDSIPNPTSAEVAAALAEVARRSGFPPSGPRLPPPSPDGRPSPQFVSFIAALALALNVPSKRRIEAPSPRDRVPETIQPKSIKMPERPTEIDLANRFRVTGSCLPVGPDNKPVQLKPGLIVLPSDPNKFRKLWEFHNLNQLTPPKKLPNIPEMLNSAPNSVEGPRGDTRSDRGERPKEPRKEPLKKIIAQIKKIFRMDDDLLKQDPNTDGSKELEDLKALCHALAKIYSSFQGGSVKFQGNYIEEHSLFDSLIYLASLPGVLKEVAQAVAALGVKAAEQFAFLLKDSRRKFELSEQSLNEILTGLVSVFNSEKTIQQNTTIGELTEALSVSGSAGKVVLELSPILAPLLNHNFRLKLAEQLVTSCPQELAYNIDIWFKGYTKGALLIVPKLFEHDRDIGIQALRVLGYHLRKEISSNKINAARALIMIATGSDADPTLSYSQLLVEMVKACPEYAVIILGRGFNNSVTEAREGALYLARHEQAQFIELLKDSHFKDKELKQIVDLLKERNGATFFAIESELTGQKSSLTDEDVDYSLIERALSFFTQKRVVKRSVSGVIVPASECEQK